jgi:hypothetical protein
MTAKDARAITHRIPASVGIFHQAFRKIESLPQIQSPTYFRVWKTPLIADCVVVHITKSVLSNSTTSSTTRWGKLSGAGGVIEVCFITPDATGIQGEPEITTFPISDRENTLLFCIFANRRQSVPPHFPPKTAPKIPAIPKIRLTLQWRVERPSHPANSANGNRTRRSCWEQSVRVGTSFARGG